MVAFVLLVIVLIPTYIVSTIIKPKKYPPVYSLCTTQSTPLFGYLTIAIYAAYATEALTWDVLPASFTLGPKWYPFFGCSGIISKRMSQYKSQWKVLSAMAKEYSTKVLGLKLGSELVVAVYGEKNVRLVTTAKEFDARPDDFFLRLRTFGKRAGITFNDGPLWREHRAFTLKNLRSNGFGKAEMDHEIHEQLSILLNILEKSHGNPINIKTPVAMAVLNVLWKFVAGEYIEEVKIKRLLHFMSLRSKAFTMAGGYLNQWPWLRFILPNWTGYSIIMKLNTHISDIIQDSIKKHKNKTIVGNDLIHSFLEEMKENELYTEDQLIGICLDILIAGSNTVNNALNFMIIKLLRHPDVEQKVYEEIRNVLGDKLPTWADSARLPYTSAFICEVHRCCTVAPFAGGRKALTDFEIDGYVIPKDATVLVSLGDLHADADVWLQPDKFMPERFIDEKGKCKTNTNVYPFSMGRRRCLGEPFAKSFLFIAVVGILQKYRIQCNGPPPSAEPIIGLLAESKYFTAQFLNR